MAYRAFGFWVDQFSSALDEILDQGLVLVGEGQFLDNTEKISSFKT
jgi:hypothetical protein